MATTKGEKSSKKTENEAVSRVPEPNRSILLLTKNGPITLPAEKVKPHNVGLKAYGLASIPEIWTSPFIVIDASLASDRTALSGIDLANVLRSVQIDPGQELILRSSGTNETLGQRGRLNSSASTLDELPLKLEALISDLPNEPKSTVHWVVQSNHDSRRQGHLSNERRLEYEKRDWVIEKEPSTTFRSPTVDSFGIRKWRDGKHFRIDALKCSFESGIKKALRPIAVWASQFDERYHLEWVWDGEKVVVVQLDEERLPEGRDPKSLVQHDIPKIAIGNLALFRPANETQKGSVRKLKNAALYDQLGYSMPPFFVLEDRDVLDALVKGEVPEVLITDLVNLTQRPLIIRTDGLDLPQEKREMLPRSDELRSVTEAVIWLKEKFAEDVSKNELGVYQLRLIAHHFIPSEASAWSRADPQSPFVRIEALWGIPEGLYYHAHDVYEIDIEVPTVDKVERYDGRSFSTRSRKRFKRFFVAANGEGKWEFFETSQKFAWRLTITDGKLLGEIAWVTKQIACSVGEPVSVMWFVGNHPDATQHVVLPWYHEKCEVNTPKAAPRRKSSRNTDFTLSTVGDWEMLRAKCERGEILERIRLEPTDPLLIRDPLFAEGLGKLSKAKGFVVELAGGILSHVYYTLIREGARVECVDLYGGEEETTDFYKVVRDRIPEIIRDRGESATIVQLKDEALTLGLRRKLVEESYEAFDASSADELVGELADVLEVVRAIGKSVGASYEKIERTRKAKAEKRGGFGSGFMLTVTETPRSLTGKMKDQPEVETCTDPHEIPTRPLYRRSDLRQTAEDEPEKLLTLEPELNHLELELREQLSFQLPSPKGGIDSFLLSVSFKRRGAALRVTTSLKRTARQLEFSFDEEEPPTD